MINSCLSYQGSKNYLIQKYRIHEFIPPTNTDHPYCELFAGSLTMFFNIDNCICAFLNDINDDLVNFWLQVQNHREELEAKLQYVWCGEGFIEALQKDPSELNRAVIFYLKNRMGTYIKFPKTLAKDLKIWQHKLDTTHVLIMHDDYELALDRMCRVRNPLKTRGYYMVIYEDPPYYQLQDNYHNKTEFDHQRLWTLNQQYAKIGHHIILSINKCPEIEEMYHDWYKCEFEIKQAHGDIQKRTELLLSNKPLRRYTNTQKQQTNFTNLLKKGD